MSTSARKALERIANLWLEDPFAGKRAVAIAKEALAEPDVPEVREECHKSPNATKPLFNLCPHCGMPKMNCDCMPDKTSFKTECLHERLNEDGICRQCGKDRRGI